MIQAVVFDLDDTLYPEEEFVYGGFRAVSKVVHHHQGLPIYEELTALFEAGERSDLFTKVLRRHVESVEESWVQELVQVYRNHQPTLHPYSEVSAFLTTLRNRYRLGILSDGWLRVQKRKLAALGIEQFFEVIIFSDQWGIDHWKPHPLSYEECARRFALAPEALVYIADNPVKDFVTARKMGIKTVRVRRNGALHYNVHLSGEFEADHEVANLTEILPLLEEGGVASSDSGEL
jgi:putative hydrolase of the HAD superfamily